MSPDLGQRRDCCCWPALILAVWLYPAFRPPGGAAGRFRPAVGERCGRGRAEARTVRRVRGRERSERRTPAGTAVRWRGASAPAKQESGQLSLTLVVQQLAALLKGGRTPARLWDELWFHGRPSSRTPARIAATSAARRCRPAQRLSPGSLADAGAARAAAFRGSPVSEAIRRAAPAAFRHAGGREPRIWLELAACFDIAEASGCPLADVLARFAAQLEVEDDAEAARQTALAGPKATVSLLTWLPLMGLGPGHGPGRGSRWPCCSGRRWAWRRSRPGWLYRRREDLVRPAGPRGRRGGVP